MNKLLPTYLIAAAVMAQAAVAQSTWTAGTNANNWNIDANWSTGVAPNAIGASAIFTNAVSVGWTNATNTIGTLQASGGSVVLGNPTNSVNNALVLDSSAGKPLISNSSTVFMYADFQGTNGFTKTGGGDFSFRFNSRALTYTGDIELLGGQLSVNQASSLGDLNNRLLVGSNSVFAVANGANTGNFNFEDTRTFVVSNAVTLSIRTSTNNISAVFSNSIVQSGTPGASVTFQNVGAAGTNEASANRYTLAGTSNDWSGTTTLQLGTKLTLAPATTISTNALSLSAGSGTWTAIDLGGNTQSVGQWTVSGSSATARTFVVSNGVLRVTNPTSLFSFSGANGTLLDMSNATGFLFSGAGSGATGRNFVVRPDVTSGANTTNTMALAAAGAGSNTITAADIIVGTASGTIGGTNHLALLVLGKSNELFANQLLIGGFNGAGSVQTAAGLVDPTVVVRGSNGVAPMSNLVVGETSSGVRPGSGVLDLSTATVDIAVTNMVVGRHIAGANNNEISAFVMGGGTLSTATLQMAIKTGTGAPTMTDTFTQNGGTVTASNITIGSGGTNGATARLLPTYNLFGGSLLAGGISAGTGTFAAASSRNINISNNAILRNASGENLTVAGLDASAGGRLGINLLGDATIQADGGRSVTLGANTLLAGTGKLTKTGDGTLSLAAAATHSGDTAVSGGTLEVADTGSLAFTIGGNGTNNSITGTGTAVINGQFVFNLAGASTNAGDTWNIIAGSLAKNYGTNFIVSGFNGSGGLWTNTTNGVDYVFSQSSGNLTVGSVAPPTNNYASWVTFWETNSGGTFTNTAGTADPDGDGFINNLEFAFDGNPTVGTPALMEVTPAGTNAVFSWVERKNPPGGVTYVVQKSSALTNGWSAATGLTISNSLDQTGILIPADYERKEFEVPASGKDFYRVQGTINN